MTNVRRANGADARGHDLPTLPASLSPAFPIAVEPSAARAAFIRVLGLDSIPDRVDAQLGATAEQDGITITPLTFQNSLGEAVPGVLAVSAAGGRGMPAVVCVTGTRETADDLQAAVVRQRGASLHGWARELARHGFATLAITVKGTTARRGTLRRWENENRLLTVWGRSQLAYIAEEALAASRVLGQLPFVNQNRIGIAGLSLGGIAAWHAMAVAPWIATAISICGGLGSIEISVRAGRPDRHSTGMYLPGLLRYFDHGELIAATIAPRPFYAIAPTADLEMPSSGVDRLLEVAPSAWAAAGHPDRFRIDRPADGHAFRRAWLPDVVAWLERWLGPTVGPAARRTR